MRWFSIAGLALVAAAGVSTSLYAQSAPKFTVWTGVYTAAQADRGKAVYAEHCARCHNEGLEGKDEIPPLKGSHFLSNWDAQQVSDLTQRVRGTMPLDNPGSLSAASTTDLVAYLLQQNDIPAGAAELSSDPFTQAGIQIAAQKP
jgi:cytochrome c